MDPSLIFTVDVERLSQLAQGLPREAIRVATLFDGKRRLWEVLRDSFLTSRMTMSVFGRLRELELVVSPDELATPVRLPRVVVKTPEAPLPAAELPREELILEAAPTESAPEELAIAEQELILETKPVPAPGPVPQPMATAEQEPILEAKPAPAPKPAPQPMATPVPPTAAIQEGFDETDRAFFDSYEPEDSSVDTFWDLEENPRKQREGRALEKRLGRSRRNWFASLLLS